MNELCICSREEWEKGEMTPPGDISVLFHPRDSSYKFSRERNCFFMYTVEKLSRKGGKYLEVMILVLLRFEL